MRFLHLVHKTWGIYCSNRCLRYGSKVAQGGKKWLKIPKSKRKEIELRSFHHSIHLDELIILVGSNVKIGWKMAKLWPPKEWPKVAARLILSQLVAILATFLKIETLPPVKPLWATLSHFGKIKKKSVLIKDAPKSCEQYAKIRL